MKTMTVQIHSSWEKILQKEFEAPYFLRLVQFIKKAYREERCYPPGKFIFHCFDACPFDAVKVVLLGQDPYHGVGQAHGLCFSVPEGVSHPPSLVNIFKELKNDLGKDYPPNGNLNHWAAQGVLLLNATLTVAANRAGSHQNQGWELFTDAVIGALSQHREGLVFLLWGNYAKQKGKHIDRSKHLVLEAGHPSPLSANRGLWFGNGHFSKTNAYLNQQGQTPIVW